MNAADPKSAAALFDRHQLTLGRHIAGLRKTELAQKIGKSAPSITQFENGDARPTPAVLAALALALNFPIPFFTTEANSWDDDVHSTLAFFRSLRSTPLTDRQRAVANARVYYRLFRTLERHVDFPAVNLPRVPHLDIDAGREEVEALAAFVRAEWNVPPGPIGNVVRLLEKHGIVVMRSEFDSARVDAFSKRFPGRSVVVLGNDKGDAARSRFDAAHELGHLMIHADEDPGNSRLERQANQFASAFLMPARDIENELPSRPDWIALTSMKRRWGVSIGALLYRSRELGVVSPAAYQRAVTKMSGWGWRTAEPAPLPALESPVLLSSAIEALAPTGYSLDDLERESFMPKSRLDSILRADCRHKLTV